MPKGRWIACARGRDGAIIVEMVARVSLVFAVLSLASACGQSASSEPWTPGTDADTAAAEDGGSTSVPMPEGDGSTGDATTPSSSSDEGPVADDEGSTGSSEGSSDGEPEGPIVGPPTGTLLVHGGGASGPGFTHFIDLAGGNDAAIVVIPTSLPDGSFEVENPSGYEAQLEDSWGLSNVTVLHTRDPAVADTDAFVAPLIAADAVWFGGGRQWRFVDAYAGTQTEDEARAVLDRGGVIGGSSAGASIQSDFLVRGDTATNTVVIGDHTVGFGYLTGVGIDQHVAQRQREYDLFEVLDFDPTILGIGLDEATWVVVEADALECFGSGTVYIHDIANWETATTDDEKILWLQAGDRYDMGLRQLL